MLWRLTIKPARAIDPWPDQPLIAIFSTQRDAKAAATLILEIYRGQGFATYIEQIEERPAP